MLKLAKKFSLTVSIAILVVVVGFGSAPNQVTYATPTPGEIAARITVLSGLTPAQISEMFAVEQSADMIFIAAEVSFPVVLEPKVSYLLIKTTSGQWIRVYIDLAEWSADFRPYLEEQGVQIHKQPSGTIDSLTPAQEAAQIAAVSTMPGSTVADLMLNGAAPQFTIPAAPAPAAYNDPGASLESDQIGSIEAEFRVTEGGSATYNIPISVAEGSAGVSPNLALSYNSSPQNGLIGVGWSLSGVSAISRCRQTTEQDHAAKPIFWNADDRFCLDGQRLLLDTGASYGAANSTYRPEIDPGIRVTAYGSANGEPDYFIIDRKDGSSSIYGGTGNSELGNGSGNTLTWAIREFHDIADNRIAYDYDGATSALRVTSIKYAYGATNTPNARVVIEYEARQDLVSGFVGGVEFSNDKRIKSIRAHNTVSGTEHEFRTYNIAYGEGHNVSSDNLSRMSSIEECANSVCLPKTVFDWRLPTATAATATTGTYTLESSGSVHVFAIQFADVNGDSKMDIIWLDGTNAVPRLRYALANTSGGFSAGSFDGGGTSVAFGAFPGGEDRKIIPFDYNADGRHDIAIWDWANTVWKVFLSVPQNGGTWKLSASPITTAITAAYANFADINSDGLVDVITKREDPTDSAANPYQVHYLKHDTTQPESSNHYYKFAAPIDLPESSSDQNYWSNGDFVGGAPDFNGDGQVDMARAGTHCNAWSWPPTCYSFAEAYTLSGDNTYESFGNLLAGESFAVFGVDAVTADFNADGLSDIVYPVRGATSNDIIDYHFRISDGTKFGAPVSIGQADDEFAQFADWNMDGFPDIVWKDDDASPRLTISYWNPTLAKFNTPIHFMTLSNGTQESISLIDYNGDGVEDKIRINSSTGSSIVTASSRVAGTANVAANRIDRIIDGFGAITDIAYEPISTSNHYSRLALTTTPGTGTFCESEPGIGEFCYDVPVEVPDSDAFYEEVNGAWDLPQGSQTLGKQTPVLEVGAAFYVVTDVVRSSPIAGALPSNVIGGATRSTSYHYKEAKLQAAGRGFLGFEQVTVRDEQTQVESTTRYRQDWPFIGRPIGTVVKSASGAILNTSIAEWEIVEWSAGYQANFNAGGIAQAGPAQVVQTYVEEQSFDLFNNGGTPGALIRSMTTSKTFDVEANATQVVDVTKHGNGGTLSLVTTDNVYDVVNFDRWDGLLSASTVTTVRDGQAEPLIRQYSYDYYLSNVSTGYRGMLWKATTEPGSAEFERVKERRYDGFGNGVKETLTGGGVTRCNVNTTTFDSIGRYPTTMRDCLGRTTNTVIARNAFGQVIEERAYVDTNNFVTVRSAFGALGRRYYSHSQTGESATTYLSNNTSNCPTSTVFKTTTTNAGGSLVSRCVDIIGRSVRELTVAFDGTLNAFDTEYDNLGQVRRKSEPFNLTYDGPSPSDWTTITYDLIGRVSATTFADNSTALMVYLGLETKTTNQLGQEKREIRNALGEIVDTYDNLGGHNRLEYDHQGNLVRLVDNAQNVIVTKFDRLGRKEWMDDPDKGYWQYEYNNFGDLTLETDAKGQTSAMTYDGLGRMTSRIDRYSGGQAIESNTTWHYDSASNGLGQIDYVQDHTSGFLKATLYDALGRVSQHDTTVSGSTYSEKTTYDEYSRVFQYFDAAGDGSFTDNGFESTYNAYGFLSVIGDAVHEDGETRQIYKKIESMNERNQVTVEKRGIMAGSNQAALATSYEYWPQTGRIKDIYATNKAGQEVQDLEYLWDEVGNLEERKELSGTKNLTESFAYDGLNRLRTFGVGADAVTLTYDTDHLGNIATKTQGGATKSYGYGAGNAGPHAVTTFDGKTYSYDANGNNTSNTERTIQYSTFDKAIEIAAGGHTTQFDYTPDRSRYRRIDTAPNQEITTTKYFGTVEIIDRPDGKQERKRYIAGVAVETVVHQNGSESGRTTNYLLHDHLGSIDVITDGVGGIVQELSFNAWGERRNATNWLDLTGIQRVTFDAGYTTRGFTGHEMVDPAGVIHMNGRIFDSSLGRFLQADPFVQDPTNSQSLNRYSYAFNNPLNSVDPSGFFSLKKLLKIVVAIVVAIYTFGAVMSWATQVGGWATSTATLAGTTVSHMTLGGMVAATAVAGASAGFVGGLIMTGNLKGAAQGAFSGAVFGGLGGLFGNSWTLARVGTYSLAGGVTSKANGASFKDGLFFAMATSFLTYVNYKMHQSVVKQSSKNPENVSGKSSGAFESRVKVAGARRSYHRGQRLECESRLGACQGAAIYPGEKSGALFGIKYPPGSVTDLVLEYNGGPHDWLRNLTGSYTPLGNAKYLTGIRGYWDAFKNFALVIPAVPFGTAGLASHAAFYDPIRAETT